MLMALANGLALPAGELAAIAGLSLSGASAHFARLLQGGLIAAERPFVKVRRILPLRRTPCKRGRRTNADCEFCLAEC